MDNTEEKRRAFLTREAIMHVNREKIVILYRIHYYVESICSLEM